MIISDNKFLNFIISFIAYTLINIVLISFSGNKNKYSKD